MTKFGKSKLLHLRTLKLSNSCFLSGRNIGPFLPLVWANPCLCKGLWLSQPQQLLSTASMWSSRCTFLYIFRHTPPPICYLHALRTVGYIDLLHTGIRISIEYDLSHLTLPSRAPSWYVFFSCKIAGCCCITSVVDKLSLTLNSCLMFDLEISESHTMHIIFGMMMSTHHDKWKRLTVHRITLSNWATQLLNSHRSISKDVIDHRKWIWKKCVLWS